jgi:predicted permease
LQVQWIFTVDWRVFAVAFVLAAAAGLTAGLAPAFESFRLATGGLRPALARHRMLRAIVAVEIAAAVVLAIAAGLLAKGFVRLAHRPLGYRTDHILGLRVRLRGSRYRGVESRAEYWSQLLERTRAISGVAVAASVSDLPMGQQYSGGGFEVEGFTPAPGHSGPHAHQLVASPGYFAAMGIALLAGRAFTEADGPGSEPVVIVNELLARTYWPGQDPIGKRIKTFWQAKEPWRRVVGVVRGMRHNGPEDAEEKQIYAPYRQVNYFGTMFLVLRTHVQPDSVAPGVRGVMKSIDPDVPPFEMRSMEDRLEEEIGMDRLAPLLMTVFSTMAALLASLGLFGVIG